MCKVSVIIPVYQETSRLERTLAGFCMQSFRDFEVIIVNDGGSIENDAIVKNYETELNILYMKQNNLGRAAARQKGLKHVSGKYVLYNDADRIPSSTMIQKHVEVLDQDETAITIGEKREVIFEYDENLNIPPYKLAEVLKKQPESREKILESTENELVSAQQLKERLDEILEEWDLGCSSDNHFEIFERYGNELKGFQLPWGIATTANMAYCREKYPKVQFDTNYVGWGMEDTDFAYQLYLEGGHFIYLPDAKNYHQLHKVTFGIWGQLYSNGRYFCYKYPCIETYIFYSVIRAVVGLEEASILIEHIKNNSNEINDSLEKLCKYIALY